jgi:acetoin utilization deacetylase AcuC-like enzyme
MKTKIGIITDDNFARKNIPPYPHPSFYSHEHPIRIKVILDYFKKIRLFEDEKIHKLTPIDIPESALVQAHSQYHVDSIKRLSNFGNSILDDEVFVTVDTYELAKKAIGGAIVAVECVLEKEVNQSLALIRPPGHHAIREKSSGLCIFNNIATSIYYLRKNLNYNKKIAIIDIDDHFGDGLAQYFYEDPDVLYFTIHEFDFEEGDIGFIDEIGAGEGLGKNINFPVPFGIVDRDFLEFTDILEPILRKFQPDIVIIAAGFDMYWDDGIGNCLLTSKSYYDFTKWILQLAEDICEGKLAFILEGGYSPIGLPVCIHSVIRALLKEEYERPDFEYMDFSSLSKKEDILKIKEALKKILKEHWNF